MMAGQLAYPPSPLATALNKARALMDVILHVGAHRTGTTSFQQYMRGNSDVLRHRGVAFWGPERTRAGLFDGLLSGRSARSQKPARAIGRVRLNCAGQIRRGTRNLIVSEENMIGSVRDNLRHTRLYRGLGERMARVNQAFDEQVGQVFLTIRSLERYWASAMAFAVPGGAKVPCRDALDRIVTQPRSWRGVITDLACAMPGAQILVVPFEQIAGRPDDLLEFMTYGAFDAPGHGASDWCNRAPMLPQLRQVLRDRGVEKDVLGDGDGRWSPFDVAQEAALKETYADDMYWLRAGADGLALLIEERAPDMAGQLLAGAE